MADEIIIEAKNLAPLIDKMTTLHERGIVLSGAWKNVGMLVRKSVDQRYRQSGENTSGDKPVLGILVSSAYQRKSTPKTLKKQYRAIMRNNPRARLSVSQARPLATTNASMTSMDLMPQTGTSGGGVVIRPTRDWAVYHHPTSFTGIGRGVNADRGYHYISDADADEAVAIVDRVIERELKQTVSGMQ